MKRAITTLASLAVLATAGPIGGASAAATVAGQQEESKFSDRFLTSLEEVDADAVAGVETNFMDGEETTNALMEEGDDRRRLSWWSLALMICKSLLVIFSANFTCCHDTYSSIMAFFHFFFTSSGRPL